MNIRVALPTLSIYIYMSLADVALLVAAFIINLIRGGTLLGGIEEGRIEEGGIGEVEIGREGLKGYSF